MIKQHAVWMQGDRIGVLLIHGLTGTPSEMRGVARDFNNAGHTVFTVQLAGHCGTSDDLIQTGWLDWYQSVVEGASRLRKQVDYLFVGGLSMGAVLALKYAAEHPVDGVLVYGATFYTDGWSIPRLSQLLSACLPMATRLGLGRHLIFNETEPYGIRNEALRRRIAATMHSGDSAAAGLPGTPCPSLSQMIQLSRDVRRHLWKVIAPCLVLHAAEDDIAHSRNAFLVRDNVSGPVDMALLKNSYHMITIDNDRPELIARSLRFIEVNTRIDPAPPLDALRPQPDNLPLHHRTSS